MITVFLSDLSSLKIAVIGQPPTAVPHDPLIRQKECVIMVPKGPKEPFFKGIVFGLSYSSSNSYFFRRSIVMISQSYNKTSYWYSQIIQLL
jgi:hypothetical protein